MMKRIFLAALLLAGCGYHQLDVPEIQPLCPNGTVPVDVCWGSVQVHCFGPEFRDVVMERIDRIEKELNLPSMCHTPSES